MAATKSIWKRVSMLKIVRNNIIFLAIYLGFSLVGYFISNITTVSPTYELFIAIPVLVIGFLTFFFASYISDNRLFSSEDSELKKILSFSLIIVFSLALWIYCSVIEQNGGWSVLVWLLYYSFNYYPTALLGLIFNSSNKGVDLIWNVKIFFPVIPVLIIWLGLKIKQKKLKKIN